MRQLDIQAVRAECSLANKLWGRTWAALQAITLREKGEEAAKRLMGVTLEQHQKGFFLDGLGKLGIREDEPPAVKAAKYHYLSNQIGGLKLEYIEESPNKVWVRYLGPMWAFPGVAMMAVPGSVRRAAGASWLARNGAVMGSRRLGWVHTKGILEMEPYDEGYFIEYDHDLAPGQEFRVEAVAHTPEFDPAKAPQLDPQVWPEERILRARRNWMRHYVKTTVDAMVQLFDRQTVYFLLSQVMRGVAIQYAQEMKQDIGIEGTDAKAMADFLYRLQLAGGREVQLTETNGVHRILLSSHLPFDADVTDGIRAAIFEFAVMAARMINGRLSLTRVPEGRSEVWEVRDAGRWLW